MSSNRILRSALLGAVLLVSACSNAGGDETSFPIAADGEIKGVLQIEQGRCGETGPISGSWFRMHPPGSSLKDDSFVTNFDSLCPNQTYTLLSPGKVGLKTGEFQESPDPAFDAATNGVADDIILPTRFYSVTLALSSERKSPTSGVDLPAPKLFVSQEAAKNPGERKLTGFLKSLFVAWNGDWFEQGSPHPNGFVGNTTKATGTINVATGRFTLAWNSEVETGVFKGTSGVWHLEGVFVPQ